MPVTNWRRTCRKLTDLPTEDGQLITKDDLCEGSSMYISSAFIHCMQAMLTMNIDLSIYSGVCFINGTRDTTGLQLNNYIAWFVDDLVQ